MYGSQGINDLCKKILYVVNVQSTRSLKSGLVEVMDK